MKKILVSILLIVGLCLSVVAQSSKDSTDKNVGPVNMEKTSDAALKRDSVDPVCHMKVSKGTSITTMQKEEQYGFCSKSCKAAFVKNPQKYIITK